MRQPDRDWIQQKLSRLTAHAGKLREEGGKTEEPEFGAWTALKLVSLTATVDVYTTIMANNNFRYYYIDAMSGSGVVDLTDRDDCLIGSPFIAGTVAHEPFEKMYLVEKEADRADALRKRLDYAVDEIDAFDQRREDCIVIEGDANEVLPTLPDRIKEDCGGSFKGHNGENGAHHLAFIDNERSEVGFDAIRRMERMWGDLLINYQEYGLNREWGKIEKEGKDWDDFLTFFDDNERVKQMETPEERFEFYLSLLNNIERGVHESLRVRGSNQHGYYYRMVYATRPTRGNSEYTKFMEGQRRKVEGVTGDEIETVLDTMKGAATHLGLWETEDDEAQSKLGQY